MIDDTSNDDIIDERIRALAAGHFNAPTGEPPRQAMWEGIAAARRAARAAATEPSAASTPVPSTPATISITPRRSHATTWRWGAALAAGLILGIIVDRRIVGNSSAPKPDHVAAVSPAPDVNHPAPLSPRTIIDSAASAPRRVAGNATPASPQPKPGIRLPIERGTPRPFASRAPADSAAQSLYRVAATQTLVQAEALLTAYRAVEGARDPQAMQQAARWARDVLSSTRLLIDSPAGRDPQMRALLTDLELILAQLVQLSGTPLQASERDLIDRAMRERDLLPRLRSAVPAGLTAS